MKLRLRCAAPSVWNYRSDLQRLRCAAPHQYNKVHSKLSYRTGLLLILPQKV